MDKYDSLFSEDNETAVPAQTVETPESSLQKYDDLFARPDQEGAIPEGSDGFLGGVADFGRGLGHAVVASGPEMAGQALQRLDIDGGNEFVSDIGKSVEEWGQRNSAAIPSLQESVKSQEAREESPWNPRGWGYQAGESLVHSVAPVATAAAAATAVGATPFVAAGAGLATVGGLFYGSTAEDTYRRAIDAGLSEEDSMEVSRITGLVEGGGEMVANAIPLRLFNVMAKPIKGAIIRSVTSRKGMKQITKDVLNTVFAEEVTEIAQSAGQAYAEDTYGVRDADIAKEIKDVIGPTLIVSALFGGGGVAGGAYRKNKITEALADPDAKPKDKDNAIATVYTEVKKLDEQLADKFLKRATFLRDNNKPIVLSPDSEYMQQIAGQKIGPITAVTSDVDMETGNAIPAEGDTGVAPIQADIDMTDPTAGQLGDVIPGGVELSDAWEQMVNEGGSAIPGPEDIIQQGANEAAASPNNDLADPTEAQKESGKYKKGPIPKEATPLGMRMMIESPEGSVRSGTDEQGNKWSRKMQNHYGYIMGMEGFDKDRLDVFFGPLAATSQTVHIVDQYNQAGEFDEHKPVFGAASEEDAHNIYHANYEDGWRGAGAITTMTMDDFRAWGTSGGATKGALVPMDRNQLQQEESYGNEENNQAAAQGIEAGAEERNGAEIENGELPEEVVAPGTDQRQADVPVENDQREGDRRKTSELSHDELVHALLHNDLTGIPNRRAYEESNVSGTTKPVQVSVDADSLKWVNDTMGHESGDAMLKGIADVLKKEAGDAFHLSGDEFVVQGTNREEIVEALGRVEKALAEKTLEVTLESGKTIKMKGIRVTYAISEEGSLKQADERLAEEKQRRQDKGERAARGEQPPNVEITDPEGGEDQVNKIPRLRSPAQLANDEKLRKARVTIDVEKDDILKAISKLGGIDFAQVKSEWGQSISDSSSELRRRGVFGSPVIRKKGGLPLDRMLEMLKEYGYFDQDADLNTFLESFSDALGGQDVFAAGKQEFEFEEQEPPADENIIPFDISDGELLEDGYNDLIDGDRKDYEDLVNELADEDFVEKLTIQYEGLSDDEYYPAANKAISAEIERRDAEKAESPTPGEAGTGDSSGVENAGTNSQEEATGENKVVSTAPEHDYQGVDDRELDQIVDEFSKFQEDMVNNEDAIHHVFDNPTKKEIIRLKNKVNVYHEKHGWMTVDEARAKIEEWKAHAQAQGSDGNQINSDKIVISLFDLSGEWSKPWREAGYQVYQFDIQTEEMNNHLGEEVNVGDVHNFSTEFFNDIFGSFDGLDVHAILAACPCTDFAVSGARHFAAKDKDGRTVASVKLVQQTMATIEHFKPAVWAIENPVGRIERLGALPPWRSSFDPNHVGEPYTKKTLLWGRFNADMPIAPVEPTEGSKMHKLYGGKSQATKNARSVTPEGFAYAFFMANNAIDNPVMTVANKYDRLNRDVLAKAVAAGISEKEIDNIVEDFYYMDLDDAAAEKALLAAVSQLSKKSYSMPIFKKYSITTGTKEVSNQRLSAAKRAIVKQREKDGLFPGDIANETPEERIKRIDNGTAAMTKQYRRNHAQQIVRARGLFNKLPENLKKEVSEFWNKSNYPKDPGYFIPMVEAWLAGEKPGQVISAKFQNALKETFVEKGEDRAQKVKEIFTPDEVDAILMYQDATLLRGVINQENHDGILDEMLTWVDEKIIELGESPEGKAYKEQQQEVGNAVLGAAPSLADEDNSVVKKGDDGKLFSGEVVASEFGSKSPKGRGATNDDMHFNNLQEEDKQGDMFGEVEADEPKRMTRATQLKHLEAAGAWKWGSKKTDPNPDSGMPHEYQNQHLYKPVDANIDGMPGLSGVKLHNGYLFFSTGAPLSDFYLIATEGASNTPYSIQAAMSEKQDVGAQKNIEEDIQDVPTDDIMAMFDGTFEEGKPAPEKKAPKEAPEAKAKAKALVNAAKHGVKGLDEISKGLVDLFGGADSLKMFFGGLNRETYNKAKPHFEAGLASFKEAGKSLKEFAEWVRESFGVAAKGYFRAWIEESKGTEVVFDGEQDIAPAFTHPTVINRTGWSQPEANSMEVYTFKGKNFETAVMDNGNPASGGNVHASPYLAAFLYMTDDSGVRISEQAIFLPPTTFDYKLDSESSFNDAIKKIEEYVNDWQLEAEDNANSIEDFINNEGPRLIADHLLAGNELKAGHGARMLIRDAVQKKTGKEFKINPGSRFTDLIRSAEMEGRKLAENEKATSDNGVIATYPGGEGTEFHVIKNDAGYAVGMMDTDAGKYLPTLRVYKGHSQKNLDKATAYASEVSKDAVARNENSAIIDQKEAENVIDERGNTDLERDSENAAIGDELGQDGVLPGSGTDGRLGEQGVLPVEGAESVAPDSVSVSGDEATPPRESGDQSPYSTDGKPALTSSDAGGNDSERSGDVGLFEFGVDPVSAEAVGQTSAGGKSAKNKKEQQRLAQNVKVSLGDRTNIEESLPFLHDGQMDDVAFTEARFSKPHGYGVLFTNGTGTGKTYSGLGVVKRFERQGKKNILIVVPDEKVLNDWIESGRNLSLNISQLRDTKDQGRDIVITTYSNLGQNDTLARRNWDLVISDESHNLMQSQQGKATNALATLRAITNHPGGKRARHSMLYRKELEESKSLRSRINANDKIMGLDDTTPQARESLRLKNEKLGEREEAIDKILRDTRAEVFAQVDESQGASRTRVVMLSATPFAYEKTIDYAEGYLFDYPEDGNIGNSRQGGYEKFMVEHFGYRIRYHKLTEPDADVNSSLMQRQFNSWLKKEKVLSGRMLDVDQDYDRRFVLTENALGMKIDEGLQFLYDNEYYRPLWEKIRERFDYLSRRYLLEAIKAREVIPLVQQHLDHGRKVVVFHDYKKGGGFNPFDLSAHRNDHTEIINEEAKTKTTFGSLVLQYEAARPDLSNIDLTGLLSPIESFGLEFDKSQLLIVNGDQKKADNLAAYKTFNSDETGPQVMLIQSAKNSGWSGHDTTGKHQRVLFNLGLPTRPTMAIQQEGRIYRVGQASNAMFRYLNTGTNWERMAFAETIARRSSAAENLALGEEARALMDSFIQAFEDSAAFPAGHENEGIGGKARDKASSSVLSEWDRAMTYYFSQAKKTSRTKSMEGVDYFATPEPVGLKMVEWAGIRDGESALEPSAGHGAIARWFPDNIRRTVVEPSNELASRLKMITDAKLIQGDFEDFNIINKFDAIVMNPPFGSGGRQAIDHLDKATKHLRDGGRVVAMIPTGSAADKKFDKWFYAEDKEGNLVNPNLSLVGDLKFPSVTFERAGTKVMARVVVIDKLPKGHDGSGLVIKMNDYTSEDSIKALFNRIENVEVPDRVRPQENSQYGAMLRDRNAKLPDRQAKAEEKKKAQDAGEVLAGGSGIEIIEHTTKKGKILKGVIRKDLTKDQAKEIDKYTWSKNGGYFIRLEHLERLNEKFPLDGEVQEESALYSGYERNTGQESVQEPGQTDSYNQLSLDFDATSLPIETASTQAQDNFYIRYKRRTSETIKSGIDKVTTPEEAAHVFAPFRKYQNETFFIMITSKDGTILEVMRPFRGGRSQSLVLTNVIIPAIVGTKGAASVWLGHNHPSGIPNPSFEDFGITKKIVKPLADLGIEVSGHIILGSGASASVIQDDLASDIKIKPLARKRTIPVRESRLAKIPKTQLVKISTADHAIDFAKGLKSKSAILLMNAKNMILASLAISEAEMTSLRKGNTIERIMAGIDDSGAISAIVVAPARDVANNVTRMLTQSDTVKVLDALVMQGGSLHSVGEVTTKGEWFSKSNAATAGTTVEQVESELKSFLGRGYEQLVKSGKLRVIQSISESPLFAKFSVSNENPGEALQQYVADLDALSYAAYEAGNLNLAENLDALLAVAKENLESHQAQYLEDSGIDQTADVGVEEQLAARYHDLLQARKGDYGLFSSEEGILENMRSVISDANKTAKGNISDGELIAAAKDAYEAKAARINKYKELSADLENMVTLYSKDGRAIAGYYKDGQITLVADNITDGSASGVMLHEGLHALFSEDPLFKKERSNILAQFSELKKNNPAVKDAYARVPEDTPAERKTEEAFAYFIESRPEHSLVKRMIAAVKSWLFRHGINIKNLTDADMVALVTQGVRSLSNSKRTNDATPGQPFLSVRPHGGIGPAKAAYERAAPRIKNTVDYLRMKFQDKFIPLLRVQEKFESEGWKKNEKNDAYRAEELFHGKATKRLEVFYEEVVQPLINSINASDTVTLAELESYLYAKFAPERNAHIASINKKFPDGGSGMTNADSKSILNTFKADGKTAELERLAKEARKITQMQRNIIRDEGLEIDETMDEWELGNENYMPLKGGKEDDGRGIGTGYNVKGSGTKQALGRRSRATNLLANLFSQAGATIVRAEKLRVSRSFLVMAEENAGSSLLEIHRKLPTRRVKSGGQVKNVVDRDFPKKNNVLTVTREDGTIVYVEIFDDDLARVMKNLTPNQYGKVTKVLAASTRYLSKMSTSLNPEFVITNFERDIQTALVHLGGEQSTKLAKEVIKGVPGAMKGIWGALYKKSNSEWAQWFERFQNAGAQVSFMDLQGVDDWQRKLFGMGQDGFAQATRENIRKVGDIIGHFNSGVENAVRLSAFRKAVEAGMSESDAASLAKNLTVNFNRKGELGPSMNALYMFANAGVQGSTRIVTAVMTSKRVRKMMGGVMLMAFGLAELNRMAAGEDDDKEDRWDKISDYSKQVNLIFATPDGEYKIRLPYGYNIFVAAGYAMSDTLHWAAGDGGKSPTETARFMTAAAMNAFNPLGGDEGLLKILAPTLADPLLEIATNENFMGGKIMPENFRFGPQKPDSELYFRNVSKPSLAVTTFLNDISGGNKWDSGMVDISPEVIDHLMGFSFGGLGRFIGRTASVPEKAIEGDLQVRDVPFLRQVYQEATPYVDFDRFYDNINSIAAARTNYKEMPASERREYLKAHPEMKLAKLSRSFQKRMSSLREMRYAKLDAGDMVGARKINLRIQKTAMRFNGVYNDRTR